MTKAMGYLSIARKGGIAELGEEPVGSAARAGTAYLIMVASDASDHTWRRAKSYAAGTDQQVIRLDETKEALGFAVGRTSLAIAAITDPALALAFVKALEGGSRYEDAAKVLEEKTRRKQQRQAEAKAHLRNVRRGGKKK